jgi:hypothetical protein
MSELLPRGEKLRRAVRFVSARSEEQPELGRSALLEEATLRFDLSPREAEMLADFLRGRERAARSGSEGGP